MTEGIKKKLAQCEQQQRTLWTYRPLSPETLQSLRDYYRVGLTYTSNALEGNSLTESETKVVIEDGLSMPPFWQSAWVAAFVQHNAISES